MEKRASWTSKIGFILAAAGSAVGLGNIWKFPRLAYSNGGGGFLVVYLIIVFTFGVGAMLAEFAIGRHTQKNPVDATRQVGGSRFWSLPGYLGVITGFIILSYLVQISGWVLKYVVAYATGAEAVYADPNRYFMVDVLGQGTSFPWQGAVIFPLIYLVICAFVVSKGVDKGIEKLNKYMMPALFLLVIVLAIYSVSRPGSIEGLKFLFKPNWNDIGGETVMAAMGQAFLSLSVGEGALCVYASYLDKKENLVSSAMTVASMDFFVAVTAGIALIPMAVTNGISVTEGGNAGFAFVSLAKAFEAMPGGTFIGFLFFVALLFAAMTGAVSVIEATVAFICEKWKVGRTKATIGISVTAFIVGVFYTATQACWDIKGIWLTPDGVTYPNLCDFMEYLTDRLLLPIAVVLICILAVWKWGKGKLEAELSSEGLYQSKLVPIYRFIIKFIVPTGVVLIFLRGFGIV